MNLGRAWRAFGRRDRRAISHQIGRGDTPSCPGCGQHLEACTSSRLGRHLPLDASGYDLDCRACRRFFACVRHTGRSVRLVRMRRFAAAVRAAGGARQAAQI